MCDGRSIASLGGGVLLAVLALGLGQCAQSTAPAVTSLTPDAHSQMYFDIIDGPHANVDCNLCHGQFSSFAQYSCTNGCHSQSSSDTAHLQITPGYTYSAQVCYQCHALGTNLAFDHSHFYPIRQGSAHAGVSCDACHIQATNHTLLDCLTCHPSSPTDGFHADVGGYTRDSSNCISCHADGLVEKLANHTFTVTTGSKHDLLACGASCHSTKRTDEPWAIDFTAFDCLGCHSQTSLSATHTPLANYSYQDSSCIQSGCHQKGTLTARRIRPGSRKRGAGQERGWAFAGLVEWLHPVHL
jgi:hypothetical protein